MGKFLPAGHMDYCGHVATKCFERRFRLLCENQWLQYLGRRKRGDQANKVGNWHSSEVTPEKRLTSTELHVVVPYWRSIRNRARLHYNILTLILTIIQNQWCQCWDGYSQAKQLTLQYLVEAIFHGRWQWIGRWLFDQTKTLACIHFLREDRKPASQVM